MKKKILFLCTHNSARSQIAEGLANHFLDNYIAFSAGTIKTKVNPFAIEVMKEIGIDISNHYSKTVDEFKNDRFDTVVTVCDNAKENCPYFPNTTLLIHKSFEDPSEKGNDESERLIYFRETRESIKLWILNYFESNP